MKKKHYIILGIVILIIIVFLFIRNGQEEQVFVLAEKGNIVQEIFETGTTERGENLRMSFKEGGRVESVLVREGEQIIKGTIIATLDKRDLELSLQEAEATLLSAQATLDRFLRGATSEELNIIKASVNSAKTELNSAESNLVEQKKITDEALRTVYQNVTTLLGDVYLTAKDVEKEIVEISDEYFTGFVSQETREGRDSRFAIQERVKEIESYKNLTGSSIDFVEKKQALIKVEQELKLIISEIDNIIKVAESNFYKDRFSETDKSLLRTYRGTINTSLASVISLLGSISSTETEVNATLNTTRNLIKTAENALSLAESELSKVTADPDSADVLIRQSNVNQALSRVNLLKNRIEDATLESPTSGTISSIAIREGENVSPGVTAVVITPEEDLQIAVDIYEGDISKINLGDKVKASFVAFPGQYFEGEVAIINPTGKIVNEVIYYEIKIILEDYPGNVLSQMTVDITIITDEKENILILPERAVRRRGGKSFVTVLENGELIEKEIQTGIRGTDRMIEIIAGLGEGENVLID